VKKFIIDAFLKPLLAIVFFLGFGGFFVFGGFQSVKVELTKGVDNSVNGKITRSHLFGFYTVSTDIEEIREAAIETRRTSTAGSGRSGPLLASGLVLVTRSGGTPLFLGFSNVDDDLKHEIKNTLNRYIRSENTDSFQDTFIVRNLFGWVGLPFFLIGIIGVLSWPVTIISGWQKRGEAGSDAA
jgi:hypothetical protein